MGVIHSDPFAVFILLNVNKEYKSSVSCFLLNPVVLNICASIHIILAFT